MIILHIAKETVELLLHEQPTSMQNMGKKVKKAIAAVIDDRLRKAMMHESRIFHTASIFADSLQER